MRTTLLMLVSLISLIGFESVSFARSSRLPAEPSYQQPTNTDVQEPIYHQRPTKPQSPSTQITSPLQGNVNYQEATNAPHHRADCGFIRVDCSSHIITIEGKQDKIDCGRITENITSTIGELYNSSKLREQALRFNPPISKYPGIVFHMYPIPPKPGAKQHVYAQEPRGLDISTGCVHVSPATFAKMKSCQGSTFQITGARGGKASTVSTKSSKYKVKTQR